MTIFVAFQSQQSDKHAYIDWAFERLGDFPGVQRLDSMQGLNLFQAFFCH